MWKRVKFLWKYNNWEKKKLKIEIFSHSLLFLYIEAIVVPILCETQKAREFLDEIFLTRNVINSKEQV